MALPRFMLELRNRENQDRSLQAIRTRYLLILGVWTFVVATSTLWGMTFYMEAIHIVCGLVLLVNTVGYSLTRRWELPLFIAIVSTAADMIAITFLVYFTGGLSSMFFALYLIQILGVSLFLNLSFSALMIGWAVVLVGAMRVLELMGLIERSTLFVPTTNSEVTDIVIWLSLQAMIFCLVAFLGGDLSNKLKFKEKEARRKKELEKLNEALQKTNESKTRLLVNVSHNLRTPLTSIMGFSELLLGGKARQQQEEFARIIHDESQHLTRLVNDTLYLAQLEADGLEWHMNEIDISKIVVEAVDAKQSLASQKGLVLKVANQTVPLPVRGDYDSLKEVMTRLIDNAIKFTTEGTIGVSITGEKGNACFSVADTGIGIVPELKDKVFEPLEMIYKTVRQGVSQRTGLGLAICREIIKHHGGRIWFESEPHKGSTFYFALPRVGNR